MPTGYTADVQSGKVTDLSVFAMRCARNFGALIMMRDEPGDTPVPETFEPNIAYHDRALAEAQAKLDVLNALSAAECEKRAEDDYQAALASDRSYRAEKAQEEARYGAMLRKVEEWVPPTAEHLSLKEFMRDQLQNSIEFDCRVFDQEIKLQSGAEWLNEGIKKAARDIGYHHEERAKEIARAAGRTRWVRDLRASLASEPTP